MDLTACVPVNPSHRRKHDCKVNFRFEKLQVIAECSKHLLRALDVPHIRQIIDSCLCQNKLKAGWLVILGELIVAVVPELLVNIRIQIRVLTTESIATRVVQPHVEPLISEVKSCRARTINTKASAAVKEAMLIQDNRSLDTLIV